MNITAIVGKQSMEFSSTVVELPDGRTRSMLRSVVQKLGFQRFAVINAIYIDDATTANFMGDGIKCIASGVKNDKLYSWGPVTIARVRFPEPDRLHKAKLSSEQLTLLKHGVHVICNDVNVKSSNRRGSYRQWLGINGSVQLRGDVTSARETIIKDISSLGISFILSGKELCDEGETVFVTFNDHIQEPMKKGKEKLVYMRIPAVVVRKVVQDNGSTLYGCKLNAPSEEINRYIYQKQIKKLKNQRMPMEHD